jgi:ribosome-binding protein aMBF1 (putative translation factor)
MSRTRKHPEIAEADKQAAALLRGAYRQARRRLARELLDERRAAGLSQRQLALLTAITMETISTYENARIGPSPGTMTRLRRGIQKGRRLLADGKRL